MRTIERTHRYDRGEVVDCRDWLQFAVVETTVRGFKIRYIKQVPETEIDKIASPTVESTEQTT